MSNTASSEPLAMQIKRPLRVLKNSFILGAGVIQYLAGKTRLERPYQAMIMLFCDTKGRSSDLISSFLKIMRPKVNLEQEADTMNAAAFKDHKKTMNDIHTDGFCVIPNALPEKDLDYLYKLGHTINMEVKRLDTDRTNNPTLITTYNPSNLKGVRYEAFTKDLLTIDAIQNIVCDKNILKIAQDYLGCMPILDFVTMWWHTSFQKNPDKEAAQYYHFDMERIKWIKFFIYITDVGPENGPHCFVRKTHISGNIPWSLLKVGYKRLEDDEVFTYLPANDEVRLTGSRGTMIAEDTRGLHKGLHVEKGHRLLLQLQYTNSCFGSTISPYKTKPTSQHLIESIKRHPQIFSYCYDIDGIK